MYQFTVKDHSICSTTRFQFGCRKVAEAVRQRLITQMNLHEHEYVSDIIEAPPLHDRGEAESERAQAIMRSLFERIN